MAKEDNLVSLATRTTAEKREIGMKGGKASGKARALKKTFKMALKELLQEQLSINTLQLEEMKLSKRDYTQENILTMKLTLKENQQKEFIKYMNDISEDLETEDVDDEEMKGYLIQRIDTFKEILQKYKEIIGDKK